MSDQPKPAHPLGATHVREYLGHGKYRDVPITPEPKPASGEWTVDDLRRIGLPDEWLEPIRDAHNAAIAAERERAETIRRDWQQAEQELMRSNKQLAAEREKVQTLTGTLTKALDAVNSYADEESTDIFYGELRQEVENWIRAEDNPGFNRYE